MNQTRTKAAIAETRRFLAACSALQTRIDDEIAQHRDEPVRRASLDLTRALAEMRKP